MGDKARFFRHDGFVFDSPEGIAGLHLYAPITIQDTTAPASNFWTLGFTWSDASSVFLG